MPDPVCRSPHRAEGPAHHELHSGVESEADLESRPVVACEWARRTPHERGGSPLVTTTGGASPTAGAAELVRQRERTRSPRVGIQAGRDSPGSRGAGGASSADPVETSARGAASGESTGRSPVASAPPSTPSLEPWLPSVNGCTIVPDALPPIFEFYGPCKRHDLDYQTCGMPRAAADAAFRENLHESCEDSSFPALCHAASELYFAGVRAFGPTAYTGGQAEACAHAPTTTWDEDAEYP